MRCTTIPNAGLLTGLSEDGIEKLDAPWGFSERTAESDDLAIRSWVCFLYSNDLPATEVWPHAATRP